MNQKTKSRKLAVVLFFGAVGLILGYFITILITATQEPGYLRWTARPQAPVEPSPPDGGYILPTHQQQVIETLKITYRGVEAGAVVFDLVVMDLDPQYAYRRQIPIEPARQGFQLSTYRFKLESAGENNLQISRIERPHTLQ